MRHIRNSRVCRKSTRLGLTASRLRKGAVWCGIPRADARGSPESGDRNSLCFPQWDRRAPRGPHDARRATGTPFAVEAGLGRIVIHVGNANRAIRTLFGARIARSRTPRVLDRWTRCRLEAMATRACIAFPAGGPLRRLPCRKRPSGIRGCSAGFPGCGSGRWDAGRC